MTLKEKENKNTLLIFSSTDGQTKKICSFIKDKSKNKSNIKVVNIDDIEHEKIKEFQKIILGASIRYGKHNKKTYAFVKKNKDLLEKKKTVFFSVNVVARKTNKNTPDTNPYVLKFLKKTKWFPDLVNVFAGKVDYPNYSFLDKFIIRLIMFITNGPTDTSFPHEFTNWQKVEEFSHQIDNL